MPAGDDCAGFGHFALSPGQDGLDHLQIETAGEGQEIHGQFGRAAHGPHIGKGVGCGNLAELEGIIHHRREEVHGGDEGGLVADAVDRRVVAGAKAYHQGWVMDGRQTFQQFTQDTRSYFRASATGRGHLCQWNVFHLIGHGLHLPGR